MRYERLIIEAGENNFTLDFHPRLTVIAGVGRIERDGLINELVGALGTQRDGVHLELCADAGNRFAIFRPRGARHRVVDVDAAVDVTAKFSDGEGKIDFLSRAGLDPQVARRTLRFGANDLVTDRERDRIVRELSQVNQNELWVAAEALRQAQRRLEEEAAAVGSSAEDAAVIEKIEERHAAFEAAQVRNESWRKQTFLLSGFSAIATVPAVVWVGVWAAVPLIALAAASVLTSIVMWRRCESARAEEEDALAEAGAHSYLGFHLQRVNGLLSSDQSRKRLMMASEELKEAQKRWSIIAGDVEVDWVFQHRDDIATAVKLRQDVVSLGVLGGPEAGGGERATALAQAIAARLGELRTLGPGSESFPALLDDPFVGIEEHITPSLLELLVRSSQHQQVILLTEDPQVASWARLESMTGAVGIIEPSGRGADLADPSRDLTIERIVLS